MADIRTCANTCCSKPLKPRQKRYCSIECKNVGQVSKDRKRVLDYARTHRGETNQQIADALNVTLNTVRSALYRSGIYRELTHEIDSSTADRKA